MIDMDLTRIASHEHISVCTDLYIAFDRPKSLHDGIFLNFRQGLIKGVSINDIPTSFSQLDPLERLGASDVSEKATYRADLADVHLRVALELAADSGLCIRIPQSLASDFGSKPYHISIPQQTTCLASVYQSIQRLVDLSDGNTREMNGQSRLRGPLIIKVTVEYALNSPKLGLVIRKAINGRVLGVHTTYGGGLCGNLLNNIDGKTLF